jgi:hypothetical protein
MRANAYLGRAALAAGMALVATPAPAAADWHEADAASDLDVHAFVSQGFIKSTDNNYLANSERGSFEFAEAGINFTKALTDRLRVGLQLFTRDLGPIGNYEAKFDWFYLDYRFADWLGIRAGRTKLPFGLYNEINDADAARVPIILPQSVYPVRSRDYLLAQTGLEIYGYRTLGRAGALDYRLYGGTIFIEVTPTTSATRIDNLNIPYMAGARLMWETPLDGLRAGGSVQALRFEGNLTVPPTPGVMGSGGSGKLELPALLWVASLEYAAHDALFAAEYSRWRVKIETTPSTLFPNSDTTSERFYVMAAYRLRHWFTPGAYYSVIYPNVEDRKGRDAWQHDAAATLRFDINAHWLLKLEGHYMKGTADLQTNLNNNVPKIRLERDWGLLLAKTTAYF